MVSRLNKLSSKPMSIPEWGTTSLLSNGNYNVTAKSIYITEAFKYFNSIDASLISYFNIDKETDWAVFGYNISHWDDSFNYNGTTYNGYNAYRECVQHM